MVGKGPAFAEKEEGRIWIMAIITISRGCFSHGKEIAERVAEMLGYECLSREILLEASHFFHVPEAKLLKSLHDAPTILERMTHGRERYLSYIQAALLEHVKADNVVYHGHAGHLLLAEVCPVLKVRVIAELGERVAFLQHKQRISKDEALAYIQDEDRHRTNWTRYLYKTDVNNPQIYDILINIGQLRVQDACEIICTGALSNTFKLTSESKKAIEDFALSRHVKAALQDVCEAEVTSEEGVVHIKVRGQKLRKSGIASPELERQVRERIKEDLTKEILKIIREIPGVKDVIYNSDLPYYS